MKHLAIYLLLLNLSSQASAMERYFECGANGPGIEINELKDSEPDVHAIKIPASHPDANRLRSELDLRGTDDIRIEFVRTNFTKCTFKRVPTQNDQDRAVFDCFFTAIKGEASDGSARPVVVENVSVSTSLHQTIVNNGFVPDRFQLRLAGHRSSAGGPFARFDFTFQELKSCKVVRHL